MPFGLQSAPSTFQRLIDKVSSSVKWKYALLYLDDIAKVFKTPKHHIEHTIFLLRLLKDDSVTHKLKKFAFLVNQIYRLRHVINLERHEVATTRPKPFKSYNYQQLRPSRYCS